MTRQLFFLHGVAAGFHCVLIFDMVHMLKKRDDKKGISYEYSEGKKC